MHFSLKVWFFNKLLLGDFPSPLLPCQDHHFGTAKYIHEKQKSPLDVLCGCCQKI